ncbi:Serine/threonine-protein kinase ppk30 [Podospora aff. communis PSN243]|uniref:non-specific serine/threonine protein kinase n=1 Tax=Podospora aff. communis PSN243 TaxID=3040156 RepID=A0AAV9HAF1_9PEZI|nr:Serine/threonine-protein kinase ppk30 [Podospora aff. communis PSN243]
MASYGQTVPAAALRQGAYPVAYAAPMAMVPPTAPAGTFAPGTKIQCGGHRVVIQKYLSEGGFAHVYLVKMPTPVNGTDLAVLKRVAVPDKDSLRGMRTEVETMKRLKGHKAIVTYIDSHASELRGGGGGYEVFLLMEYCNGGGLIDFMNTRLQHRLTEPEILNIFADVAEGVACMHYLKPPLLHRDLKVENVLITMVGSVRKFKLCDFGSAAPPRPAPTTAVECRLMDEDVQKHTTMQYRSPEMVDVYRKLPIDEKSDIWALGVLLYKLCYYTTPFEEQGQLAILNASYKFPSYPVFSDRLKKLIASMLRETPSDRPNIYKVLKEACAMQGREPPVKDVGFRWRRLTLSSIADVWKIYSGQQRPEHTTHGSSSTDQRKPSPVVGAVFAPQTANQQPVLPEVERMRRGRPTASQPQQQTRQNPSPANVVTKGDPFAALDTKFPTKASDELSSRFPTLDQFAILHDHGAKFDFDSTVPPASQPQTKDLNQRLAEKLADDAFQIRPSPSPQPAATSQRQSTESGRVGAPSEVQRVTPPLKSASAPPKQTEMSRASAIISSTPELKAISTQVSKPAYQPPPERPSMVSTGTNTTPPPEKQVASQTPYQIYRFPAGDDHHRASSLPRQPDVSSMSSSRTEPSSTWSNAAGSRTPSQQPQLQSVHIRHPSSSRPSLEGGRPNLDLLDSANKPKPQIVSRPRPVSTHLESNLDYLRGREANSKPLPSPGPSPRYSIDKDLPPPPDLEDDTNIESNVEFLRAMEEDHPKKKDNRVKHTKRSSLTSLGAGTKNILAGKFGDAFKRFEGGGPAPRRTPSPLKDMERRDLERRDLTPIAGSEATDGRSDDGRSDDGQVRDYEDMTPEMRREQEARMLAQEEARVAAAQAEHRQRVAQRGTGATGAANPTPLPKSIGGVSRAVSIQNKVQSLLDETTRSSVNVTRTAQGYGPYSDAAVARAPGNDGRPAIPRKPIGGSGTQLTGSSRPSGVEPASTGRTSVSSITTSRPAAPPKPVHLGMATGASSAPGNSINVGKTRDLATADISGQLTLDMTAAEKDDYLKDFQKRFPSLPPIELVERDLAAEAESNTGRR